MLAKMIDKIVSLKETKIFEIDGQTYADASLTRIPLHVDRPDCISVSGLDSICKLIRTELEKVGTTIMVQVKSNDTVEVMTTYLSDFSRNTLYRAKADAPGLRTGFRGREVALIELRSLCIPNEGTAYLLDLLSRMTNENSVSTNDNGVTLFNGCADLVGLIARVLIGGELLDEHLLGGCAPVARLDAVDSLVGQTFHAGPPLRWPIRASSARPRSGCPRRLRPSGPWGLKAPLWPTRPRWRPSG